MRTLFGYLLRQQTVAMIFVTFALTGAIWLTQSLNFVKLIINRGLSLLAFLEFTVLLLPSFLLLILPIALFFSVLFIYNKLINDREVVVMRASGMSEFALAWPGLTLATIVTMVAYAISLYLMPISFRQFKLTEFAMRHEYSALLLQDGAFNAVTDSLTIYVRERRGKGELLGILVQDNRDRTKPVTMMAERGLMLGSDEVPRIVMFNGNRQVYDQATGRIRFLTFERWSFDLDWLSKSDRRRWREPNERFIGELFEPGDSEGERHYRNKFIAEGHNRLASPMYALVFAMIALTGLLSGQFNKRGQARRILIIALCALPVQAGAIGLVNLVTKTPILAPLIYLNVLAPLAICAWVLTRSRRRRAREFGPDPATGAA